jgi:hypothetical protein
VRDLPGRLAVRVRSSDGSGRGRVAWAFLAIGCALVAWASPAAAFTRTSTVRVSGLTPIDGFAVDRSGDIFLSVPWEPPGAAFNTLLAAKVHELSPAGKTVGFTLFGFIPSGGGLYVRGGVAVTPNGRAIFIGGDASPDLSAPSFRPLLAEYRAGSLAFIRGAGFDTKPHHFGGPVAVDSTGRYVYIADSGLPNRVFEFSVPHLDRLRSFTLHGIGASTKEEVVGIAVGGPDDDVYVQVNPTNAAGSTLVQVYRADGTFVRQLNVGSDSGGIAVNPAGMIFVGANNGVDVIPAGGWRPAFAVATGGPVGLVAVNRSDDLFAVVPGTKRTRTSIVKFVPLIPRTTLIDEPSPPLRALFKSPTMTFRFESPTAGSTFECRVVRRGFDVGPFSPCASPETYRNSPNGYYTFQVKAVSKDGVPDPTPASILAVVEVAYAHALITSHPAKLIKKTSATFGFTSTNTPPAAKFRCRLTKYLERPAAFKPCSSPITYHGLVHDLYTFQVQAITSGGFVQPTATGYTFAVHPTQP